MYSVILPTYNERENIREAIERTEDALQGIDHETIVVDDDSPDGTWELAHEISKQKNTVKAIRRTEEKGLATAVVRGFEEAEGDKITVMDADLQHPPEKLAEIYEELDENDIVVASRKTEGGKVEEWPLHRKIISKGAEAISNILLPSSRKVKDPLSGFFGIRKKVIKGTKLNPEGYKILLEILSKGNYEKIKEIPYTFHERDEGSSSLGPKQHYTYLRHVLRLAWTTGELTRFLKYCFVGAVGVLVNMFVLYILTEFLHVFYLISGFFAVESAILSNFIWNELWTFRDRTGKTIVHRLFKFHGISAGGFAINLSVLFVLTEFLGLYYLLSNLAGIVLATAWNFSMNTLYTWKEEL